MKKIIALSVAAIVASALFGGAVHAETIESINGDVVTLDTGDQFYVPDTEGLSVGQEVEVDKTASFDNGTEGEEY